ncbi:MAG: nucleotidyltransferase [Chloroflexi bacterium]|nr:nucleotidyltransferase [Chloroflexota bacterium]
MANVQPQFDQFHEAIRLRRFVENQTLREKRDIIREKLCERLPGVFERHNEVCPPFYFRDQGSYEMGTGTKPLNGDFDIDQGLYFEVSTTTYPDPVVLKQRVFEALEGHTKDVRIRRSCVTVFYQRDQEPIYHVDIAVYADGSLETDGKARLAKGREHSAPEYRFWEVSNPQGLTEKIFARFEGPARRQFRHDVRYLKRWRDENFSSSGYAAPLGIGLTIMAYDDFHPTFSDPFAGTPNDLEALRTLIAASLAKFRDVWDPETQTWARRLTVKLPVEPWNDLFERMTNAQMVDFEGKLKTLLAALEAAARAVDPVEACTVLQQVFGQDFPIPPREETAKRQPRAIISSSSSA